jgi:hypothetical protein
VEGISILHSSLILSSLITGTDITVWTVSALLAIGIGGSRYANRKTRDKLVRELAAMDPARREKMLSRLDPKLALDLREQLMERYRIMSRPPTSNI